jgi:NitT/TauT family transport system substrate-binding protein
MTMRRRTFGALAGAALLGATGAMPAVAQERHEIIFAMPSVGMLYLPVYVADVMGYYDENGIDADIRVFKSGGGAAMASVISGDTHVYPGTPGSAMAAVAQGSDVQIFAAIMTEYASNVVIRGEVAREKGLTENSTVEERMAALEGLNIGVTGAGSGTHQLALYMLEEAGLDPERDATVVFVGGSREILASFSLGRIDAFVLSNPTSDTAIAEHDGFLLFDMAAGAIPSLEGYLYIVLNASDAWLSENPERTNALIRAINAAQVVMQDESRKAEVRDAVYNGYFDQFDKALFDAAWDRVVQAYPADPTMRREQMVDVIEFLNKFSQRQFDLGLADTAMTNKYVEQALGN